LFKTIGRQNRDFTVFDIGHILHPLAGAIFRRP
jgi:hypothetical protein